LNCEVPARLPEFCWFRALEAGRKLDRRLSSVAVLSRWSIISAGRGPMIGSCILRVSFRPVTLSRMDVAAYQSPPFSSLACQV